MISMFFEDIVNTTNNKSYSYTDGDNKRTQRIPSLNIVVNMTVDTFGVEFPTAKRISK